MPADLKKITFAIDMKHAFLSLTGLHTLLASSCRIDGEAGVGKIYVQNNASDELRIETVYSTSGNNFCPSCSCSTGQLLLTASLEDIGAAPAVQHIVKEIRVYRNDSLKTETVSPFTDVQLITSKGNRKYDTNYTLILTDADMNQSF